MRPAALFLIAAWGCGSSAPPEPEEPSIDIAGLPSLALLDNSPTGEDATAHGDGPSCEEIIDRERRKAQERGSGEEPPPEHNEEIEAILSTGTYLTTCSVPDNVFVNVCAAILDGRAEGVTVKLVPGTPSQADCVADAIRRLEFPQHDLVSVGRTEFRPQ